MDPMTALGLASNIVQFVDFSTKLVNAAIDIHHSVSGTTKDNQSLEDIVREMEMLSIRLDPPTTGPQTDDERALCRLSADCRTLSRQILALLEKIKPKDPNSKRQSAWAAVKAKWNEKEKKELQQRLEGCRSQLELQLSFLTSSDTTKRLRALAKSADESVITLGALQQHVAQLQQGVTVTCISVDAQRELKDLLSLSEAACQAITQQRVLRCLAFPDMYKRFEEVPEAHLNTFRWIFGREEDGKDRSASESDSGSFSRDKSGSETPGDRDETYKVDGDTGEDEPDDDHEAKPEETLGIEREPQTAVENEESQENIVTEIKQDSEPEKNDAIDEVNVLEEGSGTEHTAATTVTLKSNEDRIDKDNEDDEYKKSIHLYGDFFMNWLSGGKGIFHIAGKLGSGKSTLMKFLCDHPRTKAKLEWWVDKKKLVFAKHFFWRAGSEDQRSLNGLFRCLLHDTLRSCPRLTKHVLPELWDQAAASSWNSQADFHISNREVRVAFDRLFKYRNKYENRRFFFFIDGLDEYQDTSQGDYKALVDLICSWTQVAPDDVKLCVSSREYNVFTNHFSAEQSLRLQDLTSHDMDRFVRDMLKDFSDENAKSRIVGAVIERADGIFLWVALVVRSLRERLEHTHNVSTLEMELDTLPRDLESLFQYLLDTMEGHGRKIAYLTFSMVDMLMSFSPEPLPPLTLLAYSFLEDYIKNNEFAIQTSFLCTDLNDADRESRINQARKDLKAYSKGLVEEVDNSLKYTHRSVPEFFQRPEVRSQTDHYIQGFDTKNAISQLFIAELRTMQPISGQDDDSHCYLSAVSRCIVQLRAQPKAPPYPLLECLEHTLLQLGGLDVTQYSSDGYGKLHLSSSSLYNLNSHGSRSFIVTSPLHIAAVEGHTAYVAWKISHDPSTWDADFKIGILVTYLEFNPAIKGKYELLEWFLDRGVSPQAAIHNANATRYYKADGTLSFWEHFILIIVSIGWENMGSLAIVGKLIEKFLSYGADPQLSFQFSATRIDNDQGSTPYTNLDALVTSGKECRTITCQEIWGKRSLVEKGIISFREIVELAELDIIDTVLQLIDRNIKHLEQERQEVKGLPQGLGQQDEEKETEGENGCSEITQLANHPALTEASQEEDNVLLRQTNTWNWGGPAFWLGSMKQSPVLTFTLGVILAMVVPRLWGRISRYGR